ncbi:uncharacterized protein LOC124110467 [Haliotis rufescens]|uniref:uncharacterized protein LOC124110467 n=1 Tax=Haliotis rufescens TaxID=6454 RepID=UPI00201EEC83|nr:uncharacterized protein LOC124110467 [Haliotis rufescens]
MPHFLIILLGFSLITAQTRGLVQCFNCTTTEDVGCKDPFDTEGRMSYTCRQGQACFKVTTGAQVTRGCMAHSVGRNPARQLSEEGATCYTDIISPTFQERTICTCGDDLCNTAVNVVFPNAAAAVAVVTSLVVPLVIL